MVTTPVHTIPPWPIRCTPYTVKKHHARYQHRLPPSQPWYSPDGATGNRKHAPPEKLSPGRFLMPPEYRNSRNKISSERRIWVQVRTAKPDYKFLIQHLSTIYQSTLVRMFHLASFVANNFVFSLSKFGKFVQETK